MDIIESYYRQERANLIKRIKNRAGSVENAEDVVQESFCRAIQYFDAYNHNLDFGGWFNSILENTLKDYKKDERVGGMTMDIEEVQDNIHDEIVDHYLPAVKNLKPLHKKIVKMYFKLGHTMPEIANTLGVSVRVVTNVISRFTNKIRVGND